MYSSYALSACVTALSSDAALIECIWNGMMAYLLHKLHAVLT